MPAKSQAQRALLNARFGHAWVKQHHFDNKGKLPDRLTPGDTKDAAKKRKRKRHQMAALRSMKK